jgi:hypothetical protein
MTYRGGVRTREAVFFDIIRPKQDREDYIEACHIPSVLEFLDITGHKENIL